VSLLPSSSCSRAPQRTIYYHGYKNIYRCKREEIENRKGNRILESKRERRRGARQPVARPRTPAGSHNCPCVPLPAGTHPILVPAKQSHTPPSALLTSGPMGPTSHPPPFPLSSTFPILPSTSAGKNQRQSPMILAVRTLLMPHAPLDAFHVNDLCPTLADTSRGDDECHHDPTPQ
jgi:hypothetical protein